MLANGATLAYKEKGGSGEYKNLPGLKEIPEVGVTPEKVENTTLTDPFKKNEIGIGELPDMVYKFKYDNTSVDSPYRVLRQYQEEGKTLSFQETLKDGTVTEYDADISVKRTGGGVNGVIEFELTMLVQSDITITDPA
jgi:hypothetical protein